jgi:phosphatidylinositol 4-kinase
METKSGSSAATLERIQNETQRVKRRLASDSERKQQEQQEQHYVYNLHSIEVSAPNRVHDKTVESPQEALIIEPSTGSYFEDPVPANHMSSHLKSEHEAFKSRLIDEVLGKDAGDKVPIEKVVMIIWQFRDDPQVVKFMTRFVAKFSGSKHVFDGVEFYLPQLAHMIIHLEAEWDDAILERFSLVIAQQSLHFALQLNWILQGAIEDYQPELPDGNFNPNYNPLYHCRCIKLLTNMERCVVYRKPRTVELQRLYEKGKISKQELQTLEHADRRFNALEATGETPEGEEAFGGMLLYKRTVRTACYKSKPWKTRYFAIEERMLNCYNSQGGRLVRSMPLEGARVEEITGKDQKKYKCLFLVSNRSFEFRMRAASEEDLKKWLQMLTDEANSAAVFGHMDSSVHAESEATDRVVSEMTPAQRARYEFFRDERDFIRRLTDIAEELRFKEPPQRKKIAPKLMKHMYVAPTVYSPLCNSSDIWRRVHGTLYKDTKVFNTKARCPVIMYFLAARGEVENKRKGGIKDANLDVAEYMHKKFDVLDESFLEEGDEEAERSEGYDEKKAEGEEESMNEMDDKGTTSQEEDSAVWHDSIIKENAPLETPASDGNRHLNRFLRESFVSIPRKLASRIDKPRRRHSQLDDVTDLKSVPILEGDQSEDILPVSGGISVGKSSVLGRGNFLLGDMDEGEIDKESMHRAKQVVSHGETWSEKSKRMLEEAKHAPEDAQLEVVAVMSKSNDDLRQEVFIMQMIHYYKSVFAKANLPIWLKTYRILSTSSSTGLLEVLVDAVSIDGLKKADGYPEEGGLRRYFEETYDGPDSQSFKAAQQNFMRSLAGYSIISYLLGLKDRHNGNIMIDTRGHVIHIDFGFVMGMAPGHEFSMERAPFKLTKEYVEVMGGIKSDCYKEYERLFVEGFKEARKNSQIALGLVEIMMYKSNYPCFEGSRYGNGITLRRFEKRLMLQVQDRYVDKRAKALVRTSLSHWG